MPAKSPLEVLRTTREKLPASLRDTILALGDEAVGPLIAILQDESLDEEGAPGDGWPPIHAVDLLADLANPIAIEPLLDALGEADWDTILHNRIAIRLHDFGPAALEPLVARLDGDIDEESRGAIVCVLAELGVQDERVFRAICDDFDTNAALGASNLLEYGDRRGLPLIAEAILRFDIQWDHHEPVDDLRDLVASYEALSDAPLPDSLGEHVAAIRARFEAGPPARSTKVGRNEPCPCGSGKKYKKCCIDKPQVPAV
jgi:hypothetical protein